MKLNEAIELVLADNCENNINTLRIAFEEYKKNRKVKEFEETQIGKLFDLLDKNPAGMEKENIMEIMGISKGNFGSIIMGMRKKEIGVVKIGKKYVLEKYIKIGE